VALSGSKTCSTSCGSEGSRSSLRSARPPPRPRLCSTRSLLVLWRVSRESCCRTPRFPLGGDTGSITLVSFLLFASRSPSQSLTIPPLSDPWSYILGGKIFFVNWNVEIRCKDSEFSVLQPPAGQTCGAYLSDFLATAAGYVDNPDANADCRYCGYANGNEYLRTLNINDSYIGWRNIGITALWVMAFWGFTVGAMAWRSRKN
jgi:hypothetical protein